MANPVCKKNTVSLPLLRDPSIRKRKIIVKKVVRQLQQREKSIQGDQCEREDIGFRLLLGLKKKRKESCSFFL